jgi:hypothetical protein
MITRIMIVGFSLLALSACGGNATVGRDGSATGGNSSTPISPTVTIPAQVF